jgi:hypothetical protein
MGLNSENAFSHSLIFDCETYPVEGAERFIDPPDPDKRLTDPEKIKSDMAKKIEAQRDKCSLDWNLARCVVLGYRLEPEGDEWVLPLRNVEAEAEALAELWHYWGERTFVGFKIRTFDLPLLITRSRLLGVPYPRIGLARFGTNQFVDLYDDLTFSDTQDTFVMRRTLTRFCERYGLDVPADPTSGKDIAALIKAGDWDGAVAHCRCDLAKTRALAQRLGLMQAAPALAEVF